MVLNEMLIHENKILAGEFGSWPQISIKKSSEIILRLNLALIVLFKLNNFIISILLVVTLIYYIN